MRSTATRTGELEIGLAAKQETDTLISSGMNKNRRTCGDSVKKDRRESKGERRQEQARVNPVRRALVKPKYRFSRAVASADSSAVRHPNGK